MKFTEQNSIIKIWECKSITRAAEILHITQPALSRILHNVELELGTSLFLRDNKHFSITPAGKIYIEKIKKILLCQNELEKEIGELRKNEHILNIKIGIQSVRAPRLLPKLYNSFNEDWPNSTVTFIDDTGQKLLQALKQHELDMIVTNQISFPSSFNIHLIRQDHLLLVASAKDIIPSVTNKEYPWNVVDLNVLTEKTIYLLPMHTTLSQLITNMLHKEKIHFTNFKEISHQEAALHLAVLNKGLTFTLDSYLPLFSLPKYPKYYYVKQFLQPINYVTTYPKNIFTKKKAKLICDTIDKAVRSMY